MGFAEPDPVMTKLATALLRKTRQGRISWADTDKRDQYVFPATSSSVLISSHLDSDGDRVTRLVLVNNAGAEVAVLECGFEENRSGGYKQGPSNELLNSLFIAVTRNVLGINNALRDIYVALGEPLSEENPGDIADLS